MINLVVICGRMTRDAEIRYAQGNEEMCIAKYTLAVERKKRDDGADFINCVAFGRNAEFAEKYLSKGTKIIVTGHIQTGSYTNKDGVKVYTTDVIVDSQEFAESKREEGHKPVDDSNGFMNIPQDINEELPFAMPTR